MSVGGRASLGSTIDDFEKSIGEYESEYTGLYSFNEDAANGKIDQVKSKRITLEFIGEAYIPKEQALKEILQYIPKDAKKIKEKVEGGQILQLYTSEQALSDFQEYYSDRGIEPKGAVTIRVIEGEKGSTVRREGITTATMNMGNDAH